MKNPIQSKYLVALVTLVAVVLVTDAWAGKGGPGGGTTQVYDTTFAQEYSYSCMSGGCHENNAALVSGYAQSLMTHAMVKCNACHGTHTVSTVGKEKPNLTGYYPGIGPTGYMVGKDRCLVCHSAAMQQNGHPNNPGECLSCHSPHEFSAGGHGR